MLSVGLRVGSLVDMKHVMHKYIKHTFSRVRGVVQRNCGAVILFDDALLCACDNCGGRERCGA